MEVQRCGSYITAPHAISHDSTHTLPSCQASILRVYSIKRHLGLVLLLLVVNAYKQYHGNSNLGIYPSGCLQE